MSRAFFFAHMSAWGIIWGHVLVYYAIFAHREWRAAGGRWRDTPREALGVLGFTLKPLIADVWGLLRHGRLPTEPAGPYRWSKPHRIGFFISLAALVYFAMGITMAINPDRTMWPLADQLSHITLVTLTSLAGLGHLFSALEHSPRRWRWFVAAILAYYPLAMLAFGVLFAL